VLVPLAVSVWLNPFEWTAEEWDAIGAGATVAAVVVALAIAVGGGVLRQRRERKRRPELSLAYRANFDSAIERTEITQRAQDGTESTIAADGFYLRLAVSNRARREAAQNVEVLVVSVDALEGAPGWETLFPWWADSETRLSSPPLGWTHSLTNVMTIPGGITRTVDLAVFLRKVDSRLRLALYPQPLAARHFLNPGTYRFVLALSAENSDATYYGLTVKFDGTWGTDTADVWEHVTVTAPPIRVDAPAPGPSKAPKRT
jgi:hypothetical protein